MRRVVALLLAFGSLFVAGASGRPGAAEAPRLLSRTGLYAGGRRRCLRGICRIRRSTPSGRTAREEPMGLSPGRARIDARDADAWVVPPGSKFWKEFSFGDGRWRPPDLEGDGDEMGLRHVSLNEEQTDAVLAPGRACRTTSRSPRGSGTRSRARRTAPTATRRALPASRVNALQLSTDRDRLRRTSSRSGRRWSRSGRSSAAPPPAGAEGAAGEPAEDPEREPSRPRPSRLLHVELRKLPPGGGNAGPSRLDFSHPASAIDEAGEPGFVTTVGRTGKWAIPGRRRAKRGGSSRAPRTGVPSSTG